MRRYKIIADGKEIKDCKHREQVTAYLQTHRLQNVKIEQYTTEQPKTNPTVRDYKRALTEACKLMQGCPSKMMEINIKKDCAECDHGKRTMLLCWKQYFIDEVR